MTHAFYILICHQFIKLSHIFPVCVCVCVCLVSQSCLTLCDPMDSPGSSVHGILQARILKWVAIPQGIFSILGLNPGLPHCRQILYHLSHQGSPTFLYYHLSTICLCVFILISNLESLIKEKFLLCYESFFKKGILSLVQTFASG